MYATEVLKQEHRVIERMLPVLEEAAGRLAHGRNVDTEVFDSILDFMRTFADKCHHAKEEDQLFPVVEANGIDPEGGLIAALKDEHEDARKLVKDLEAAVAEIGTEEAGTEVDAIVRVYCRLLRMHIEKEDITLFPLTDRRLSAQQQMELAIIFEDVEDEEPCKGAYDHYRKMIEELEERLGMK